MPALQSDSVTRSVKILSAPFERRFDNPQTEKRLKVLDDQTKKIAVPTKQGDLLRVLN
jgi:hypothetical protein